AAGTARAISRPGGSISATNGANSVGGTGNASAGAISLATSGTLTPGTITAGAGVVNLTAGGISTAGLIAGGSANLSSASQVGGSGSSLTIDFGTGPVVLTGSASAWNLRNPTFTSPPTPAFTPIALNTGANVF